MEYLTKEDIVLINRKTVEQLQEPLQKIKLGQRELPQKGETTQDILYYFTIEMASGEISLESVQAWFEDNMEPAK